MKKLHISNFGCETITAEKLIREYCDIGDGYIDVTPENFYLFCKLSDSSPCTIGLDLSAQLNITWSDIDCDSNKNINQDICQGYRNECSDEAILGVIFSLQAQGVFE